MLSPRKAVLKELKTFPGARLYNRSDKGSKLPVAFLPTFGAIAKSGSARLAGGQADEKKERFIKKLFKSS